MTQRPPGGEGDAAGGDPVEPKAGGSTDGGAESADGGAEGTGGSPEGTGGSPEGTGGSPEGGVYEWYTRGLELLRTGSASAAVQLLQRAAEAEPGSHSIKEALARAQYGARRFGEAAESFRWIIERDPSEDYALFGLGLSLSRMGDFEGAVEHLALAAAMRPDNGDYAKALRHARATLRSRR